PRHLAKTSLSLEAEAEKVDPNVTKRDGEAVEGTAWPLSATPKEPKAKETPNPREASTW
ncbi:hypothetical protein KI387_026512, partial [Taxus chinensis]